MPCNHRAPQIDASDIAAASTVNDRRRRDRTRIVILPRHFLRAALMARHAAQMAICGDASISARRYARAAACAHCCYAPQRARGTAFYLHAQCTFCGDGAIHRTLRRIIWRQILVGTVRGAAHQAVLCCARCGQSGVATRRQIWYDSCVCILFAAALRDGVTVSW